MQFICDGLKIALLTPALSSTFLLLPVLPPFPTSLLSFSSWLTLCSLHGASSEPEPLWHKLWAGMALKRQRWLNPVDGRGGGKKKKRKVVSKWGGVRWEGERGSCGSHCRWFQSFWCHLFHSFSFFFLPPLLEGEKWINNLGKRMESVHKCFAWEIRCTTYISPHCFKLKPASFKYVALSDERWNDEQLWMTKLEKQVHVRHNSQAWEENPADI